VIGGVSASEGGRILVEDESRTTWENVSKVIPLIEEVDRIKIVSQSLHAEKARGQGHLSGVNPGDYSSAVAFGHA